MYMYIYDLYNHIYTGSHQAKKDMERSSTTSNENYSKLGLHDWYHYNILLFAIMIKNKHYRLNCNVCVLKFCGSAAHYATAHYEHSHVFSVVDTPNQ